MTLTKHLYEHEFNFFKSLSHLKFKLSILTLYMGKYICFRQETILLTFSIKNSQNYYFYILTNSISCIIQTKKKALFKIYISYYYSIIILKKYYEVILLLSFLRPNN